MGSVDWVDGILNSCSFVFYSLETRLSELRLRLDGESKLTGIEIIRQRSPSHGANANRIRPLLPDRGREQQAEEFLPGLVNRLLFT